MRPFLLPYKMSSKSSRILARTLDATRIYPDRRYRSTSDHLLINWGYSGTPQVPIDKATILNHPRHIDYVSDKVKFFKFDSQCSKVTSKTNKEEVKYYIEEHGSTYYCRTLTRSKGGAGIVVAKTIDELVDASLYTKHVKGKEFRLHVFKDKVFHIQQKRKMSNEKLEEEGYTYNKYVKNHKNGWVFAINEVDEVVQGTLNNAILCIKEYGLDFGAVDIIQNDSGSYILEVNTAPGLEGTTLTKYSEVFEQYLEELNEA